MLHAAARQAIPALLADPCFADRALLVVAVAEIDDLPGRPSHLRQALISQVAAIAPCPAAAYVGHENQATVPADAGDLARQLAGFCIDHPADIAANLTALHGLVRLWPHVTGDERPVLRRAFLTAVNGRSAPPEAVATREQLRQWTSSDPTLAACGPGVAGLADLLAAPTARAAFLSLSSHIVPGIDLRTVFRVLGTLAVQQLLRRRDAGGRLSQVVAASVAGERLVPIIPPEVTATMLGQLAHRLWWLARDGGSRPLVASLDQAPVPLDAAIASGDLSLAQRSARQAAQQGVFWGIAWNQIARSVVGDDAGWPRLVRAAIAIASRQSATGGVAPDDAAALATILGARVATTAFHRRQPVSEACIVAS
jgi:hypothetical protein